MIRELVHWTDIFNNEFTNQLNTIVDTLENRLLPVFDGIADEARKVSEDEWGRLMSLPGSGEEDPSDMAEAAEQAGATHYESIYGIRQGVLNLFAVSLYHIFEQQLFFFARKEILPGGEGVRSKRFKVQDLQKRLLEIGIDLNIFCTWKTVEELRLVANTVKHAEGDSATKLHKLRPDLFKHPEALGRSISGNEKIHRVYQPLIGDDLYISLPVIKEYKDALIRFWEELSDTIQCGQLDITSSFYSQT